MSERAFVGLFVSQEGWKVGAFEGKLVGKIVGSLVEIDGFFEGIIVGLNVGVNVGYILIAFDFMVFLSLIQ